MTPDPILTAPTLYALAEGDRCEGDLECYWCGAPCGRQFPHDDRPAMPFVKADRRFVKRPGSAFTCRGCWLFRRRRITVRFLSDAEPKFLDIQCPLNHSWVVTERAAYGVRPDRDAAALYELLLDPPLRFALSLIVNEKTNPIQSAPANNLTEIKGDTPLSFFCDWAGFTYTVCELEHVLLTDKPDGAMPGTRLLYSLLGPYQLKEERSERRKRGRPSGISGGAPGDTPAQKVIRQKAGARSG